MRLHAFTFIVFFSVAAQFTTHSARAQMSQRIDVHGVLVHSDPLPSDTHGFEQLQVAGKASLTPLEKRTLEIINEFANESSREASADAATVDSSSLPSASSRESASAPLSLDPAAENARDPCLLSWDRRCYEKHAQDLGLCTECASKLSIGYAIRGQWGRAAPTNLAAPTLQVAAYDAGSDRAKTVS